MGLVIYIVCEGMMLKLMLCVYKIYFKRVFKIKWNNFFEESV